MTDRDTLSRIEALTDTFRAHGYHVAAESIPGEEATFADALEAGHRKLCEVLARNARSYGYRGRSRNALAALHADLPSPAWGIEVRQP